MTLCIAAICCKENKIVTVSDYLLTNRDGLQQELCSPKFVVSPKKKWLTLFAGEKRMAEEVWYSGREALKKTNEDSYLDVMNAQHAALSTAAKEYRQHCEMEKQVGISKHPLLADTELILAGFGSGRPHLIVVSEFHKPRLPKKEHFAVIGNATGMVEAILTDFFEFNPNASLAEIIYKVCAVKFAAEAHRAIGKGKTCVTIHNSNGEWWYLPFERVDKLRTLCRQVPTGIEELLGSQPVAVVDDEEGELYCATDPDFNANFVRPKA